MSTLQNSNLIAAALGATIGVVSVATVFIYHKVMERQQHSMMNKNIDNVSQRVTELQAELEKLRTQQANLQKRRRKQLLKKQLYASNLTLTETEDVDIDTFSTAGTDFGDDEFFDCSDDETETESEVKNVESEVTINSGRSELSEFDKEIEDSSFDVISSVYHKLKNILRENPEDIEIVWRFAKVCYKCSVQNPKQQQEFIYEGLDACENMLSNSDGNLYKWYAILVGVKSKFLPTKGKIENGYLFKEYVEKALEIIPNDGYLHHLMGRFKYEVSELSWIERKIASTLFAEVPSATYADAIPYFEQAEKLTSQPHYENKLFLGKSYIAVRQYKQGVSYLSQLNEMSVKTDEDSQIKKEASKLLEKYSEYCT